jgi:hypothetical protein
VAEAVTERPAHLAPLRPIGPPPGNRNAQRHGAFSERENRRLAVSCKRRLLRQVGLHASDLDGVGRALLDTWGRAQAKVEALDAFWDATGGFLDEEGTPRAGTAFYLSALNTAGRTAAKLSDHLAKIDRRPVLDLAEAGRRVRLARDDE